MEIDKDGTIRFKEPEVFFSKGESELKTQFKDILDSFFPRYINVIYKLMNRLVLIGNGFDLAHGIN